MDIFVILVLIVGYLIMATITAIVFACYDPRIIGDSPGLMAYTGILWPIFIPVGLLYLTLGVGTQWIFLRMKKKRLDKR